MANKLVFLTLFVLVASTFAELNSRFPVDFVYQTRKIADTKTEIIDFVEGFLNGVASASLFDEVRACIGDGENFVSDVTTAIADIQSKDAAKVEAGIKLIGQAAQIVPNAIKACKSGASELKDIVKMVESFQSPLSFLFTVGKSILINHVEVIHEVENMIEAYQSQNWNQFGYWVGKAMDTIFLGSSERVQDVNADVLNFAEGFLTGVGSAPLFDQIKACFTDASTFTTDIVTGVEDIKTKDPAKVKEGIYYLGQAAEIVPNAAQACKAAGTDVQSLVKFVETFQNPASFLYYIGKSLVINHVEVINEVTSAVSAYESQNYNQLGYWVGKAMDTIILGQSAINAVTVKDTKTDILDFVEGFLQGVGSASAFDQIRACVTDSEDVVTDLTTAVKDFETKDPAQVEAGIKLIGQAVQIVPDAVQECKAGAVDLKSLVKMVESFKSPVSFLYYIGKSLLINHVDVIKEIENVVTNWEQQNYEQVGYWVGKAMDTVLLGEDQTLSQDFADHLNKVSGWKAGIPSKFEGMTYAEIKGRFLGAKKIDLSQYDVTEYNYEGVTDVPSYFNASQEWPGCIHPIRDQGQCGSCWAFAASEVLSDRLCIASNGSVNVVLSPQYLISCNDVLNHGCNGGVLLFSWLFMDSDGMVTDSCLPYESYNGTNPLKCKDFTTCADGTPLKKYYAKGAVSLSNPASIQANLIQYGPVEAGMTVYQDFMYYQGGIYKHTSGSELGGHAVKITGWGNENGENYWIVANSWGPSWGENGFFRIAWGQCGIDSGCVAGQADLSKTMTSENRFW